MEQPTLAGGEIGEGEFGLARPDQLVLTADRPQECECRIVGRQQQMIAVVESRAQSGLEIGPAAAAGMTRELVDDDLASGTGKPYRGGESGQTGAHDMHRSPAHQTTP